MMKVNCINRLSLIWLLFGQSIGVATASIDNIRDPFQPTYLDNCVEELNKIDVKQFDEWAFHGVIGYGNDWHGWLKSNQNKWVLVKAGDLFPNKQWIVINILMNSALFSFNSDTVRNCATTRKIDFVIKKNQ